MADFDGDHKAGYLNLSVRNHIFVAKERQKHEGGLASAQA